MSSFAQVRGSKHDDWLVEFKDRATPRLRKLFTSERDFTVLPDVIAEPLKLLALTERNRR
ncbi:MAG TPA: hypothetical protein PKE16_08190 [Hyphomicrobium sp.]|nr:hypothetical protein [Hyphomicrobium sp.]